ncbi:MAG: hypothetical protein DBY35_00825 [Bacteroidales bacterium]|nr:MAG: hypothetical protein DBY35_00825 [Bacteroidales bacterium]
MRGGRPSRRPYSYAVWTKSYQFSEGGDWFPVRDNLCVAGGFATLNRPAKFGFFLSEKSGDAGRAAFQQPLQLRGEGLGHFGCRRVAGL